MAMINYLTQIHFDFGAIRLVQQECERLAITKPLIVTDPGVKAAGLLDRVLSCLDKASSAVVFDETPSNPTEKATRIAADLYTANECNGIIALGGGSAIDLGKAAALCVTHPGPLQMYAAIEGGVPRITASVAPLIAIPTTAGTGSEVGRGALVIMEDGRKLGILSPYLVPKSAICDPELTFWSAAATHCRDRHGCHCSLHGDLHVGSVQSSR